MNLINSVKGIFLSANSEREDIVARLLEHQSITAREAALLLKAEMTINIKVDKLDLDISSGAKVMAGDDNSVEHR